MARGRKKGTVGVVGLGNMGGAYARHLATAGWRVIGVDPDAKRRRALAKAGGTVELGTTVERIWPTRVEIASRDGAQQATGQVNGRGLACDVAICALPSEMTKPTDSTGWQTGTGLKV